MLWMFRSVPPVRWFMRAVFWFRHPALLVARWRDANALYSSRLELAALSADQRRDVGLTLTDIRKDTDKPVFGEVSPWAPTALHDAARQAETGVKGEGEHVITYQRSFYRDRGRADLSM